MACSWGGEHCPRAGVALAAPQLPEEAWAHFKEKGDYGYHPGHEVADAPALVLFIAGAKVIFTP